MPPELTCAFCGKGPSEEHPLPDPRVSAHPLLIHRGKKRVWVHYDCVVAAPGVYVDTDNKWHGITKEIVRARKLKCHICKEPGASIGCANPRCQKSAHLPCALELGGWDPHEDPDYRCEVRAQKINLSLFARARAQARGVRARKIFRSEHA